MFWWLYYIHIIGQEDYLWTTLVLALSGITDLVDGMIVRYFHMVSNLGKAFDPVADKLTQIAVLFYLIGRCSHMIYVFVRGHGPAVRRTLRHPQYWFPAETKSVQNSGPFTWTAVLHMVSIHPAIGRQRCTQLPGLRGFWEHQ